MNTDKRYWLFAGSYYYPSGGMEDFIDSFDSVKKARAVANQRNIDWYHIYDAAKQRLI